MNNNRDEKSKITILRKNESKARKKYEKALTNFCNILIHSILASATIIALPIPFAEEVGLATILINAGACIVAFGSLDLYLYFKFKEAKNDYILAVTSLENEQNNQKKEKQNSLEENLDNTTKIVEQKENNLEDKDAKTISDDELQYHKVVDEYLDEIVDYSSRHLNADENAQVSTNEINCHNSSTPKNLKNI